MIRAEQAQLGLVPVGADVAVAGGSELVVRHAYKLDLAKPSQVVRDTSRPGMCLIGKPDRDVEIRVAIGSSAPARAAVQHPQHIRVGHDALLEIREWKVNAHARLAPLYHPWSFRELCHRPP